MLFAITSQTWIVTGLGFGIVLVLLFCLVYIMKLFGWIMQKVEKGSAKAKNNAQGPTSDKKAAKTASDEADMAAIAMALYLNEAGKHDPNISVINLKHHDTAWNPKSEGFNNIGF